MRCHRKRPDPSTNSEPVLSKVSARLPRAGGLCRVHRLQQTLHSFLQHLLFAAYHLGCHSSHPVISQLSPRSSANTSIHGLCVVYQEVAPGEEIEPLAVAPQILPVMALGAPGLDD